MKQLAMTASLLGQAEDMQRSSFSSFARRAKLNTALERMEDVSSFIDRLRKEGNVELANELARQHAGNRLDQEFGSGFFDLLTRDT